MTVEKWIETVADVATAWQDPDYDRRSAAVQAILEADNRYTEEGLAFALNHRMRQLNTDSLGAWLGDNPAPESLNVGIVCAEAPPLSGLVEAVAALVLGHRVWITQSVESPALVLGFLDEVMNRTHQEPTHFVPLGSLLERADLLVASGTEERLDALEADADAAGIPPERRLLTRDRLVVAVIDGREDDEARSGLAEDLLLHEGESPRSPSVVWAPAGHEPDRLLDTLAGFRELYPAHPDTNGSLSLPTAFLASAKQSHAMGPGFLVSKGEPEPQRGAHIRWSEYQDPDAVRAWAETQDLGFVVAAEPLAKQLNLGVPVVSPGDAHRPELGDETPGLVPFLKGD